MIYDKGDMLKGNFLKVFSKFFGSTGYLYGEKEKWLLSHNLFLKECDRKFWKIA